MYYSTPTKDGPGLEFGRLMEVCHGILSNGTKDSGNQIQIRKEPRSGFDDNRRVGGSLPAGHRPLDEESTKQPFQNSDGQGAVADRLSIHKGTREGDGRDLEKAPSTLNLREYGNDSYELPFPSSGESDTEFILDKREK